MSFIGYENFDLNKTLEKAKQENKTVLLYFSSIACVNCRKMEEMINENSKIKDAILEEYIFITLMVDDRTPAEQELWKQSEFSKDTLRTIGKLNSQLQIELTKTGHQPHFAILTEDKKLVSTINFTEDKNDLLKFIKRKE
ncbi:thioredoxin family protein [Cytophagaceae bacterium ABcell3]|nr:thioredoxin family protein [Cytophagaceae bacterium ABcell3]